MNELRGLWRGKRIDNGEWVEGVPCDKYIICGFDIVRGDDWVPMSDYPDFDYVEIDPSTLGEYTRLTDKNGTLIFEGYIIEYNPTYGGKTISFVKWDEFCWNLDKFYESSFDEPGFAFSEGQQYMTVIGNIHDNPDLLPAHEEDGESNER